MCKEEFMEVVSYFLNRKAAWDFMRKCESNKVLAGYPFSTNIEGIGLGWGVRWIDGGAQC